MNTILTNDILNMRRLDPSELSLMMPFEEQGSLRGLVVHQSVESHLEAMNNPDIQYVMFDNLRDGSSVGFAVLSGLLDENKSIELRRIVVFIPGNGYGRQALKCIKKYAFEYLGAHRLWLDVRIHNTLALNLYESEGFVIEGIMREAVFWNNQFISVKLMSILVQEYRLHSNGEICEALVK